MLTIAWASVALLASAASNIEEGFHDAVQAIERGDYYGIDAMLIYHREEPPLEKYFGGFGPTTRHQTRSTFKSITGLIAAVAADEGVLDLDEPVLPLLAPFGTPSAPDNRRSQLTVRDLLNMTSGINCTEMPGDVGPNHEEGVDEGNAPLLYSLNIDMAEAPGNIWRYCNANSFLLGAAISGALERAGKADIFAFAREQLFTPLGISDYEMYPSPEGLLYAAGNARFLPQDLGKIGLLVLGRGLWRGQRIISESHVQNILLGNVETHWSWTSGIDGQSEAKARYAYQWHGTTFQTANGATYAPHTWGNGGQFIFVLPDYGRVVVFTGRNYGDIDGQKQPFDVMARYLLPAMTTVRQAPVPLRPKEES